MWPENGPFSWKVYSNLTSRPENRLISWPQVMSFLLRTGLRRFASSFPPDRITSLRFIPPPCGTGLRRFASSFPSGQDYVASLHPFLLDRITSLRFILSSGQDYVADAPFSFALPRVILRQSKSMSCIRRTSFFAHQRPLREQALDGPLVHEKSTQRSLSAFALV